jgi:hypothetical protein
MAVLTDTLSMAERTEHLLRLRLHRINMQAAGLVVKSPNSGGPASMLNQTSDFGNAGGAGKLKRGGSGLQAPGGGYANMV